MYTCCKKKKIENYTEEYKKSSPHYGSIPLGGTNAQSWGWSDQTFFCAHLVYNLKFQIQTERGFETKE